MAKFLAADLTIALMRLTAAGHYAPNGQRDYTYYLRVPDFWLDEGMDGVLLRVDRLAQAMYTDLAAGFRAAEPNDPNYLAVLHTATNLLTAEQVAAAPWHGPPGPPMWEETNCVVVHADGDYTKVAPAQFAADEDHA